MNEFVEQCRREWRRLRVPTAVADELAAELSADLAEAQAEGVAQGEVVGDDPRALARAWAAERGFVRRRSTLRRVLVPAAIVAAAAISSVVTLYVSDSGRERVSPPDVRTLVVRMPAPPPKGAIWVTVSRPNETGNPAPARVYTGGP